MPWTLSNGLTVDIVRPGPTKVTFIEPERRKADVLALPAGTGASGFTGYEFTQVSASALWSIPVPTDFPVRRPAVEIYIGNVDIEADVTWLPSTRTVTIEFPAPVTGVAVLT